MSELRDDMSELRDDMSELRVAQGIAISFGILWAVTIGLTMLSQP